MAATPAPQAWQRATRDARCRARPQDLAVASSSLHGIANLGLDGREGSGASALPSRGLRWGRTTRSLFRAIAEELKDLRQQVKELRNSRDDQKSWAQVAAPKKTAKAPTSGKTEVIVVPDFRETEIKHRAGTATLTAVKAQVGNVVEAARRLPDGSTVLRVAPAQGGSILEEREWIPVVFGKKAKVSKGGLKVLIKGIPTEKLSNIRDQNQTRLAR
ncbi:MAG: hypothetical protein SEPTF4163_005127 [Sporothrix epigloea]